MDPWEGHGFENSESRDIKCKCKEDVKMGNTEKQRENSRQEKEEDKEEDARRQPPTKRKKYERTTHKEGEGSPTRRSRAKEDTTPCSKGCPHPEQTTR